MAFVEDNEIAYMTGRDLQDFQSFINQVIKSLFSQYEIITTEIDDCDPYAMTLFDLYPDKPLNSWDTYLLNNSDQAPLCHQLSCSAISHKKKTGPKACFSENLSF